MFAVRAWRRGICLLAASVMALGACGGGAAGESASAPAQSTTTPTAPVSGGKAAAVPAGDWPEFGYNAQRSDIGPSDTGIGSGSLRTIQTRVVHIDGVADSSAVELRGVSVGGRARDVIVVTTTYGKTIAIDPGTGARLWEYTPSDIRSYQGSFQVTTASPIADPNRQYIYAASPDGFIHKLALGSGRQMWATRVTSDAGREKLGTALNITGAAVVVTTGGYYGDAPSYQGHVVLISRATGRIQHVWNSLCSNRHRLIDPPRSCPASDSAIWARAGAVVEPGSRRILVATGNGPFNGSTNWGDSVLELTPNASRLLHNWTPRNQAQLSGSDTDLGSTAPAVLPIVRGYRLAVQGGKDGMLHLLNLNRLNGTRGGPGRRLGGEVQDIGSPGGGEVLTAPAVWSSGGRVYVFVADGSGTAAYVLRVSGGPHLQSVWRNGTSGTSPVLAGGLLYVYDDNGGSLDVYNPTSGHRLASLGAAGGHWSSPVVVGGRIVLPVGGSTADDRTSGEIFIYHLPGR
jgi:outer membrane protein assembly factor BamB